MESSDVGRVRTLKSGMDEWAKRDCEDKYHEMMGIEHTSVPQNEH